MPRVSDMRENKKVEEKKEEVATQDEFNYKKMSELIAADLYELHKRFGVGGVHGEDFPPNRYSYTEIVNDFTNETDFVKYSDERYVRFLESRVAQLEYELSLRDNEASNS